MSAAKSLELEVDGGVGRIVLNRPDCINALSVATIAELTAAARYFDDLDNVRVVVFEGRGRGFCAGADVKDFAVALGGGGGTPPAEQLRKLAAAGKEMVDALAGMKAVTVASVHGCAIGGGLLLMAMCDLRVADRDTRIAVPELAMGLPFTWGGLPRLVQELGVAWTRDLLLTSRTVTANELAATGFINRLVATAEREAATATLVANLLDQPPLPLRMTKAQLVEESTRALPDGAADADRFVEAILDDGFMAAAMKYLQRLPGQGR